MIAWLKELLGSSVGKKLVMALSGLLLFGFLVLHLAENLLLYADRQGETFDGYVHTLTSFAWVPLAELALAALFLVHIAQAVRVSLQNRSARRTPYAQSPGHGGRTLASTSMLVTGSVVLVFLVLHLVQFRFAPETERHGMAHLVKREFAEPLTLGVYLLGLFALGIHLAHGLQSALQSLGVSHPRFTPLVRRIALLLALLLVLGFATFPVYFYCRGGTP